MRSNGKKIEPSEVYRAICECTCAPDDFAQDTRIVEVGRRVWGFHIQELERHRDQVSKWLWFLPQEFRYREGGEFLDAGYQNDRTPWTVNADRIEHLLLLGQAMGLVSPVPCDVDEDGNPMRYIVFV